MTALAINDTRVAFDDQRARLRASRHGASACDAVSRDAVAHLSRRDPFDPVDGNDPSRTWDAAWRGSQRIPHLITVRPRRFGLGLERARAAVSVEAAQPPAFRVYYD